MELIKLLGAIKQSFTPGEGGASAGWGGAASTSSFGGSNLNINPAGDSEYLKFVSSLQENLIKDYTTASIRGRR